MIKNNLDADTVKGYLESAMHRLEFPYVWENGFAVFIAGIGSRRWKMAIKCLDGRIALFAAYPRQSPIESREKMLEILNKFSAASAFGSYFLLETGQGILTIYRCDVIIPDEYSIFECIECGLKYSAAGLYSNWENLHDAANRGR